MLTPAYKLTIGDRVIDTTDEPKASTVVGITVTLDLDTPADTCQLVLGNVGRLRPQREDELTVALGYADDDGGLTQVLTGAITTVEPGMTTTRVLGYSGCAALLGARVEQTFERKTSGAIIRDLAQRASIDVQTAEDGITFPAYVIDGRRSLYHHMFDLATLCGFDLYIDPAGKLVFEKFVGGKAVHVFEFGKHVVGLDVTRAPPLAGQVEAWGESPTGSQGDDAWAWLTKDFGGSKGAAGTGARLLIERPALRTIDAARAAANAELTAIKRRTLRGRLTTIGRPEVKLGDAIRLRGMADDALNTSFQVRGVTHRITKVGGFTTTIDFRAIEI